MTSRNPQPDPKLPVLLLALLVPACADVEDAQDQLARELAPTSSERSAEETQRANALASGDGGAPEAAITSAPGLEGSLTATDSDAGSDGDAGSTCEADWECGASAYCARASQRCTPRCQGDSCVGPSFARDNDGLISDGRRVCFADDSDVPGEYALRLWDGSAAQATTLTRAMGARALFLDDAYCYFHAAGALRRAGLNGGCVELVQELATPPERVWRDGDYVHWLAGAAQAETRIASRQNAKAEPAASASVPEQAAAAPAIVLPGGVEVRKDAHESRLISARGAAALP